MKPHQLASLNRPSRYLGGEYNSIRKNWQSVSLRIALLFPDLYEIGMSHQGLQILYHILNKEDNFLAERCYCPTPEAELLLKKEGEPLSTLESGTPLAHFDILGFTLPYELCYTNILTILDCAKIPLYSHQRDENQPLVIGGGSCALNPEPVADFFDAILLGDGEEAVVEIAEITANYKDAGRGEKLRRLTRVEGLYIPQHFTPHYSGSRITAIKHKAEYCGIYENSSIRRRIVNSLSDIECLEHPLVPNAKIVHDRLGIEIARGCTRGCRFCQAGMIYRPVRERDPEQILQLAETAIKNSGFEELALLSLSTGDYSCIEDILSPLMDRLTEKYVSLSMPSMRVGTLTAEMMEQIKRVRKTGFTLAPEAGSERLRRVINKGITEQDLLAAAEDAFRLGWKTIKCYFMIGLPTETDEDITAIAQLAAAVSSTGGSGGGRGGGKRKKGGSSRITVSVGTFVPKPHTPFQWQEQIGIEESYRRIHLLKNALPQKGSQLKYHDPKISWLEGVFSRGDRRLAALIEAAWRDGARLDGWAEHFNLARWTAAAERLDLDLEEYLRRRSFDETLPWSHLDSRIAPEFLRSEYDKAIEEAYTPDCRYHACQKCGLCDFQEIAPIVCNRQNRQKKQRQAGDAGEESGGQQPAVSRAEYPVKTAEKREQHFKYMVHYSRRGTICCLGHLEILQLIFRTLRRAEIPLHYSQGFNPSPKVSFGPALPVGTESRAEFFMIDIKRPLKSLSDTIAVINRSLPEGLEVTGIEHCGGGAGKGKMPDTILSHYTITLPKPLTNLQRERIDEFAKSSSYIISRMRKKGQQKLDIRPIIKELSEADSETVSLSIISASSAASVKPAEALRHILQLSDTETARLVICKECWDKLA